MKSTYKAVEVSAPNVLRVVERPIPEPGSLAGTAIDTEDALAFSVLENIRPMIETMPLEQAPEAYARMMQGKARFRMVLTTNAAARPS
jgi:D-arabinose 1-dehydrogenase-like Zn-dependent alcohol dehydrogenase